MSFLALVVAGLISGVVSGGGILLTQRLQRRNQVRQELWKARFETYVSVAQFALRWMAFRGLANSSGASFSARTNRPTTDEYNALLVKLWLLADHPAIPGQFVRCMGWEGSEAGDPVSYQTKAGDVTDLTAMMRLDLGARRDPIPENDWVLIDLDGARVDSSLPA